MIAEQFPSLRFHLTIGLFKTKLLKTTFFAMLVLTSISCSDNSSKGPIFEEDGVAMKGYDFVAYSTDQEAKKGSPDIYSEIDGIKYYFTSKENKATFDAAPNKYLPEYGGWCAYAILKGNKMNPDPTNFQMQDGKLLFYYSDIVTQLTGNLKDKWNESPKEHKKMADEKWEEEFN